MDLQHYSERYQRIWRTVAEIPYGCVATYGQIAALAGIPRGARQVGYALHQIPEGMKLPWHRVINARGEISFPRDSDAYRRQREGLDAEGVVFKAGRIDLTVFGWRSETPASTLDELLWRPNDADSSD